MGKMFDRPCFDMAGVDWAQAWLDLDARRGKPSNAVHWTKRSETYGEQSLGDYEREFLDRAGIEPGSTVLDFGCGVGLLAIPLAKAGCKVIACDFSEGMLERLRYSASEQGVLENIDIRHLAWEDDWDAAGIGLSSVDYALASRSIATSDLAGALRKLGDAARKRVFVTVAAGTSPRRDERAFEAVGRRRPWLPDYAYCMNVLFQYGVFPELAYIETRALPAFADEESAVRELSAMLGDDLDEREQGLLRSFIAEHYRLDPSAPRSRSFASDAMRCVRWAFISWDVRE